MFIPFVIFVLFALKDCFFSEVYCFLQSIRRIAPYLIMNSLNCLLYLLISPISVLQLETGHTFISLNLETLLCYFSDPFVFGEITFEIVFITNFVLIFYLTFSVDIIDKHIYLYNLPRLISNLFSYLAF
jgi:hypothetical protein